MPDVPELRSVVLDATDARALAEFYRLLLGYRYRPGDEAGDDDWLVLLDPGGGTRLAFQRVPDLPASTWPDADVPQQLHLDLCVPSVEALAASRERALALGARLLQDRAGDPDEPLYVFADPARHPFCIFVAAPG